MNTDMLFMLIVGLGIIAFVTGRQRAASYSGATRLKALPKHYGSLTAIWSAIPALLLMVAWSIFEPVYLQQEIEHSLPIEITDKSDARVGLYMNTVHLAIESGELHADPVVQGAVLAYQKAASNSRYLNTALVLLLCLAGIIAGLSQFLLKIHARARIETILKTFLMLCSGVAILATIGIVLSVLFEALRFFDSVSVFDFMFGTAWSPQTAIREGQVGSSGTFGAVPLFLGTMLISIIAMTIAVPVGLMTAIYLSEYASPKFRAFAKPALEILAGIPTVVYGFFAALTVAPFIREMGESIGLSVASESALAAGIVMGVMIIPFVSSLSDDVISAVPRAMRDGSLALGATHSETIKKVIIPAALPGIVGSVLLAASRAIGETMIVVMAAGLSAKMTINPLEAVTTVTVQIVTLLTGDQEFDSPKTLAAFALGLMLFFSTLVLNIIALHIVRKYREQYE
ncbi:MAG: phosphate transport system permease protein [Gammaproteobacteria bacterium]|jgi:phosphate transport system permease protein